MCQQMSLVCRSVYSFVITNITVKFPSIFSDLEKIVKWLKAKQQKIIIGNFYDHIYNPNLALLITTFLIPSYVLLRSQCSDFFSGKKVIVLMKYTNSSLKSIDGTACIQD